MTTTTLLDLRALAAPEPMERVLDTLDRLHGYAWRVDWQRDGACLVAIARTA